MTPKAFTDAIQALQLPSVFNPYSDHCSKCDRPDAAKIRRRNLVRCIESAIDLRVNTIWIARDLGYRGGRRTGVALTDEMHLSTASALMGDVKLERATHGPAVSERTATVIWRILAHIGQPVFLWNVFPLHPHDADEPFSNRCHTRAERDATWPLMLALIDMIKPERIVAIGREAGLALPSIDLPVHVVRHPSYGGQTDFINSVCQLYRVAPPPRSAGQAALDFA